MRECIIREMRCSLERLQAQCQTTFETLGSISFSSSILIARFSARKITFQDLTIRNLTNQPIFLFYFILYPRARKINSARNVNIATASRLFTFAIPMLIQTLLGLLFFVATSVHDKTLRKIIFCRRRCKSQLVKRRTKKCECMLSKQKRELSISTTLNENSDGHSGERHSKCLFTKPFRSHFGSLSWTGQRHICILRQPRGQRSGERDEESGRNLCGLWKAPCWQFRRIHTIH